MANDFYQIYRGEVKRLARTMVIRFELSALAMNRYLTDRGIPVGDDKKTWRYYMNIAGLYHSTNTMMQVRSLDTDETIDFTRENMKIHRATARNYVWGTRYYRALVAQWSRQETLIKGIINPVDMDLAINARENEILWMPPDLVESNEDNLKELIQSQIDGVLDRWHTEMYSKTEDLYDCTRYAILFAHLPAYIEYARIKNSRTERAHSFHIREFLASNGRLDKFFDAMTKEQQLFFYRNLPYLHRYPGHQDSFDWLKQEVLEKRMFPLADYQMVQNIESMPEDLEPTIEMLRTETTADYAGVPATKASVNTVLRKQSGLALRNAETLDENETEATTLMTESKISSVQTKVLESDVLDMSDSQVFKLEDYLIQHWGYLASQDRYRAIVSVEHPRTGEPLQMSALDAFILFLYAYNLSVSQTLTLVPDMVFSGVLRNPVPSAQQMFDKVCDGRHASLNHAEALWEMIPEFTSYISTESFYAAVNALYNGAVDQHNLAAFQGNYIARGEVEAMGLFMFQDVPVSLAKQEPYDDWLQVRGLASVKTFTINELQTLWSSLFATATGSDLNISLSLNDIHRAMIGIMQRLSSYSVHYIRLINSSPLKSLDNKFIRLGDTEGNFEGAHEFDILKLKELTGRGTNWGGSLLPILDNNKVRDAQAQLEGDSMMFMGLSLEEQTEKQGFSYLELPYIRMWEPELREVTDLSLYSLTTDIVVPPVGAMDVQLSEVIYSRVLSGLNYPRNMVELPHLSTLVVRTTLSGLNYPE